MINMNSRFTIMFLMLLAGYAHAAIENIPIKSNIELKPGQAELITVDCNEEMEIGWEAVQESKCTMHCVEATDKSGGYEYKIATDLGASMKYSPVDGKIIIEYKNVSEQPVLINVHQVKRTCDAEACGLVNESEKGRRLVFKVDKFISIETSKDESYSTISGITTDGDAFAVKAVWWTDNNSFTFNCYKYIKDYLDKKTPKEEYSPYILSGSAIGFNEIILKNVDTCTPKAPHFGVPEKNVYHRDSTQPSMAEGLDTKLFMTQSEFSLNSSGKLSPMINFTTNSAFAILTDEFFSGQTNALEIFFFKKLLTKEDLSHTETLKEQYDTAMVLFIDKENKIWQVNLTCVIPGNTKAATVAWKPDELKQYFSDYLYDGKQLKLKSKGSYHDSSQNSNSPIALTWDVNLDIPVFNKLKQK